MNFALLTQTGGILGPFASALGFIFELIYKFFALFGIESIALCIFVFTVVVRVLLFPMQLKSQKYSKITSVITPEVKKIQKKYENKKDQESQIAMNQEMSALYKKYGVSPAGSCLQLLIQMPILFSLYRVIYNIPAYVGQVKNYYMTIISNLSDSQVNQYFHIEGMSGKDILKDPSTTNKVIDIMSNFRSKDTQNFVDFKLGDMISAINIPDASAAYDKIVHINNFWVYNLKETPKDMWATIGWLAIIIPILAGLFQYITVFLSSKMNPIDTSNMDDNPMISSMKTMNIIMPVISVFFTWSFASGIGLYWVAGSVVMVIQQIILYIYFKVVSVDDIIAKSVEKAKKKSEKRGIYENMIAQAAAANGKNINNSGNSSNNEEKYKAAMEKYNTNKPKDKNSISARANMVRDFNNNNK